MLLRLLFFVISLFSSSIAHGQWKNDYDSYLRLTRSSGVVSQMENIRSFRVEVGARNYLFGKSEGAFKSGIQIALGAWSERGPDEPSCRDCSLLLLRGIELSPAFVLRLEQAPLPVLFSLGLTWAVADAQYLNSPGVTPPPDAIDGDLYFSYTAGVALELPLTERAALLGSIELQRPVNRPYYVARLSPWLGVRVAI